MLRPCRSSQGHGTAHPSRDGLWAICPRSASSGYHAEFHEGCYQKHTNLRRRWPVCNQTTFVMDEEKGGSSTLKKKADLLNCWTSSSDISGYHADFHEGHALSGHGRGAAWHVWVNGTGTTRERYGRGMGTACYVWIGLNSAASSTVAIVQVQIKTPRTGKTYALNFTPSPRQFSGQVQQPECTLRKTKQYLSLLGIENRDRSSSPQLSHYNTVTWNSTWLWNLKLPLY